MAEQQSRRSRLLGGVSFLMVALFAAVLILRLSPWGAPEQAFAAESATHDVIPVTLELKDGSVELELWSDVAPKHVEQITTLVGQGFYDGIVFHRVIDGFMAQTGDPTGTGMGGSELGDIDAEFSDEPFVRGSLGMARSRDPNSANSQFFITFGDTAHLNGQYTVFGRVISGMEHVDAVKKGDSQSNGLVDNPDAIISMKIAQD